MNAPRIAIVHISKTAGNTLIDSLRPFYDPKRMAPNIRGWNQPPPSTFKDCDFIAGHFGYAYAQALKAPLMTVLREPVDRVVSLYHFWHRVPDGAIVQEMTFDECLASDDPGIISGIENAQTWQLAYEHAYPNRQRLANISEDALLDLAKRNLSKFAVVGITENLPAMQAAIRAKLGLPVVIDGMRNKTEGRPTVSDIPEHTLRMIEHRTRLDRQLYAFVQSHFVNANTDR